ncbi:MAG TPA: biopolymer transporter ExbD [Allosphingosinicella sp.]|jgi:biopolymer transport protein ExbD
MTRHRRMSPAFTLDTGSPMSGINTTPLIDVMLVLLIMFIITIPLATHGVKIDLPNGPTPIASEPVTHKLAMNDAGALTLDGAAVTEADLSGRLRGLEDANPMSQFQFQVDGSARYEDFDRVLAEVKKAGIQNLGFVGNQAFLGAI